MSDLDEENLEPPLELGLWNLLVPREKGNLGVAVVVLPDSLELTVLLLSPGLWNFLLDWKPLLDVEGVAEVASLDLVGEMDCVFLPLGINPLGLLLDAKGVIEGVEDLALLL